MTAKLSEELKLLIAQHIETVGQLEVLLLLHRDPQRTWSPSAITRELRGTNDSTARWLEMWRTLGFVSTDNGMFRFQPATTELQWRADELAQAYQLRPGAVIEHIYALPNRQLREFVRAFEFRKMP